MKFKNATKLFLGSEKSMQNFLVVEKGSTMTSKLLTQQKN